MFVYFEEIDLDRGWYYGSCKNCNTNVKDAKVGDTCPGNKCAGQKIKEIVPRAPAEESLREYSRLLGLVWEVKRYTGSTGALSLIT